MASDFLLEIDGIKGEAQDSKIKDSIEIESCSLGGTHPGSFSQGMGGSTGKVNFQDVSFTATINKATPRLMQAMATGEHLKKATVHCRKATGKGGQHEYLTVTLSDCLVSSHQVGAHNGGTLPSEQFSLNFTKIKLEYKPQNADGSMAAPIEFEYDVKKQEGR